MPSAVDYITLLPEGKQGPIPVPEGSWNKNTTYVRTDYKVPFVEHNKLYYLLMKPESIGVNPQKDYAQNGMNATWVLIPSYEMVIVQALVANGGSIGGAHYMQSNNQDYMISKKGTNLTTGEPDTNFTDFPHNFEPNWWVNFTTGDTSMQNAFLRGVIASNYVDWWDAKLLPGRVLDVFKNCNLFGTGAGMVNEDQEAIYLPDSLPFTGFTVNVFNSGIVGRTFDLILKTKGDSKFIMPGKQLVRTCRVFPGDLIELTAIPYNDTLAGNNYKLGWIYTKKNLEETV